MAFLKVAILYFLGSIITVLTSNYVASKLESYTSPFEGFTGGVFAVFWFTICFSLFDWFVLRKIVEKQKKRK